MDVAGSAGANLARISNGLVHLHTRYYGKGPVSAKTYRVNDTAICILQGGFTTAERTLIDEGRSEAVHDIRRSFEEAMETQFSAVVEEVTGRKVIAFMSQIHVNPDIAVQIFVLEPSGETVIDHHELALDGGLPRQS